MVTEYLKCRRLSLPLGVSEGPVHDLVGYSYTTVQPGSLCNLREQLNRKQIDKVVKVFNTGDEFLLHCFKAHLKARICTLLHFRI